MSFIPAWTIKPPGILFKKSWSLSKIASLAPPGILFTLMLWFYDKPFSWITISNESPAIIIFLFLNCSFVQLHEFLVILESSLFSSESLDWSKETLALIPFLTTLQLSSTNFFVKNFITVSFCFSWFYRNPMKPQESRDAFCTLLLAIIASSIRYNLLSTESWNSLKHFTSFKKPSRFSSFFVLSIVVFVSSVIGFSIFEKFGSSHS